MTRLSSTSLRIALVVLTVAWAALAVQDVERLGEGYELAIGVAGERPTMNAIEFSASHKIASGILSLGIVLGVFLAMSQHKQGFPVLLASAVGLSALAIWGVGEYGTMGSPVSAVQFGLLVSLAVIGYLGVR